MSVPHAHRELFARWFPSGAPATGRNCIDEVVREG